MNDATANSFLQEGIYYADLGGVIKDLYYLKYDPNDPCLFEVKTLANRPFDKEYIIEKFNYEKYYDPARQITISYIDAQNVHLLIDVINRFYSNRICGVMRIKPTHTRPTRMYLNLLSLISKRNT